jgi:thiamine-monophosphate kinase
MTQIWSEQQVISVIKSVLKPIIAKGANDLLDDGASLPPCPKGHTRVVSCDAFQEGTDFIIHALSPLESAGHRAVIQNLSDLGAMGAKPVGFIWSLEIPKSWLDKNAEKLRQFCRGTTKICLKKNLEFYGGDLSFSPSQFSCTITIFGDVKGKPLNRRGAKPGDSIYLSRPVGASTAGLKKLLEVEKSSPLQVFPCRRDKKLIKSHVYPDDECLIGQALVGLASACMDVSDGLSQDLYKLCQASNVSAIISSFDEAIDLLVKGLPDAKQLALGSGEEYALLFTLPLEKIEKFQKKINPRSGILIGEIIASKPKQRPHVFFRKNQKLCLLEKSGYDHFSSFSLDQAFL